MLVASFPEKDEIRIVESSLKGRHYNLVVNFVDLKNNFVEVLHILSQTFPFMLPYCQQVRGWLLVMLPPNEVPNKRVTELFKVCN